MKILLCLLFLLPAYAQTDSQPGAPAQTDRDKPPANAKGQSADRSVVKPKPGQEAIKPQDYHDSTGYWHPFERMGRYFLYDQKAIWTSPFHTSKKDSKWWVIFGGATGALIATDKYVSKNAPSSPALSRMGTDVSYLGEAYTLAADHGRILLRRNGHWQRSLSRNGPAGV